MISKMKKYEHNSIIHAKRFAKAWDYHCVSSNAYLAGYRDAKEAALEISDNNDKIKEIGEEEVEVEFTDGMHQLSATSFVKWKKENDDLPFKEALKTYLGNFHFEDLRVVKADNGVISFQGLARKK